MKENQLQKYVNMVYKGLHENGRISQKKSKGYLYTVSKILLQIRVSGEVDTLRTYQENNVTVTFQLKVFVHSHDYKRLM